MICTNWFCINSTPNVFLFPFKYSAYVRFDYYHSLWGKTWSSQGSSRICPFICKRNIFMHHTMAPSSSTKPQNVISDVYFVLRVHLLQCAPIYIQKNIPCLLGTVGKQLLQVVQKFSLEYSKSLYL